MQYRHLFPMVRILLPFMAGIIVSNVFESETLLPLFLWISLLLLTLGAGFIPAITASRVKHWLFGVLLSMFLFVSGYNSVILHKEILRPNHFSNIQSQGIFIARVQEPVQKKDHSYKTILKVTALKKGDKLVKSEGLVLTYFAKDTVKTPPAEGSLVAISGKLQLISPAANPGAFDYRKYMASNNVYHQVYLYNTSWRLLEQPQGFSIYRFAHQVSDRFISILNSNGLKGREFAVASALLLGQKDMLDNETRQAFAGSGVMHVLCVSGLHVGVIYIIISFLLGFMKNKGSQLLLKTFVILFTIWFYAFLAGLSPSVMRAAIMFTFITFGHASKRYVHIINSLAVSALVLLLIDPLMINSIGFQLSYLAILGIVFVNKPIADLWNPSNKILRYFWQLAAVSVSAQVATAPLSMFYFHQFPLYFIPANLIAIPVSFLAIYSGLAVLVTSFVPVISNFFGLITNSLLFALNYCMQHIEQLPFSVQKITSVFSIEMLLIYLTITAIVMLFYLRRKQLVYISLAMMLLLSVSFTSTEMNRLKQQEIIFYSAGKSSATGFICGRRQTLLADSVLINDKKANQFQLDGTKSKYGISHTQVIALDTLVQKFTRLSQETIPFRTLGNHFLFHNKRIAVIDSLPKYYGNCKKLKLDYLVIRNNPKIRIDDLTKFYQPELILFDGSNLQYKTGRWMEECKKAGLKAYCIKDSGAYVVKLQENKALKRNNFRI